MFNRVLLGGLLGGVVVFVWGVLSWMVLPWHYSTLQRFADETAVARVVAANTPHSGIYVLPNPGRTAARQGQPAGAAGAPPGASMPLVFASVRLSGDMPRMGQALAGSLAIQVLGALLAGWLLSMTCGLGYLRRVLFVGVAGVFAAAVGSLPYWDWWGFSGAYTLVSVADIIIGWFLGGLAIAKLIRGKA